MLQRIQTIWLLLATICTGLMIYFPVWASDSSSGMDSIGAGTQLYLLIISTLIGVVEFISIFLFTKRKTQINFSRISIVLTLLFIIVFVLVFESESGDTTLLLSGIKVGSIIPVAIIIFNLLAIRGIKKDEEIVRSMDRLR